MALAGLSTLGITFGYGVETTAGTKPSAFSQLTRINSIGGISITPETIDASALEDYQERSISGRQSTGGDWSVTFNLTTETEAIIEAMLSAATTATASILEFMFFPCSALAREND